MTVQRDPGQQEPGPARDWAVPLVALVLGVVVTLLASVIVERIDDPEALEPGRLRILSGSDDSVGGQRNRLIEEWNALHEDNPASIVTLPPDADKQRIQMLTDAQSDADDPADILNLDVTWTAEFAHAGYLRSLDESRVRPDDFLSRPLSTCYYAGRLWALPFNTDVGLLYYRSDLLERIGQKDLPPTTWERLADDVDRVRAGPAPGIPGYLGQLADYEGLTVTAQEAIWGAGGTVVDDDGKVLPEPGDGHAVEVALGRLRDLSPSGLPPSYEADSLREFRAGRAVFMRNWPVAFRKLTEASNEGSPPPFAVAQLPGSGALGGQNLAISARSPRPKAARALIEFLTGDRSQQLLFERGGLPATRKVVYTDPQVTSSPLTKELLGALNNARRRPTVPHYAPFSQAFRAVVLERLHSTAPLDENRLRTDLEAALDGRLPPPTGGS